MVRRLRRIGRGRVRGRLYDLGEYPGAVLSKTGPVILGQISELPDDPEVLEKLDEYEGFDPARPKHSLFVRKRHPVSLAGGKEMVCWIYTYNRHPGASPRLTGRRFSERKKQRVR